MNNKRNDRISIVMYHYIKDFTNPLYKNLRGLDAALFDEQLTFFEKNFNVLRMQDLLVYFKDPTLSLPPKSVLLTFDDGYYCHYSTAYPILKKHKMQGAFFIPAKILEHPVKLLDTNKIHLILANAPIEDIYNELNALLNKEKFSAELLYKKYATMNRYDDPKTTFCKTIMQNMEPLYYRQKFINDLYAKFVAQDETLIAKDFYITKAQLKEMQADGMFFGNHGYRHSRLGNMTPEEIQQDIDHSLVLLKDLIDFNENGGWVMNYPYGHASAAVVDCIKKRGALCAITTEPRIADLMKDSCYLLPRLDCNDFPPKSEKYKELL